MKLKAVLFDLDGVITDTAKFHYLAWKHIALEMNIEVDEEFNETLKGIDRRSSMLKILKKGNIILTEEEILKVMEKKNNLYLKMLEDLSTADLLPGIIELFEALKNNGIKISIASASKNAKYILEKLGVLNYIDFIADPNLINSSKPDPEIFLLAAKGVFATPAQCVGIEDSIAGIESLKSALIKSIGVNVNQATYCVDETSFITYDLIKEVYEK